MHWLQKIFARPPRGAAPEARPDDPAKAPGNEAASGAPYGAPYKVYCRDYDRELRAEDLDSVLDERLDEAAWTELQRQFETNLAVWRMNADFAALAAAARIRAAVSEEALNDFVVTLLIDHSGSMRGQKILLAAGAAMVACDLLNLLGVRREVLGFTTARWKGGQSREKWLAAGKPENPGRLNDLLHIIYSSADDDWKTPYYMSMLRKDLLKENIDGEAIEWAASRLRQRSERRKCLIVISDGAPVDDSTLTANNGRYLADHLKSVIASLEATGDVEIAAVGLNFDVGAYYRNSVVLNAPDQLGGALLELIERILSGKAAAPAASQTK